MIIVLTVTIREIIRTIKLCNSIKTRIVTIGNTKATIKVIRPIIERLNLPKIGIISSKTLIDSNNTIKANQIIKKPKKRKNQSNLVYFRTHCSYSFFSCPTKIRYRWLPSLSKYGSILLPFKFPKIVPLKFECKTL